AIEAVGHSQRRPWPVRGAFLGADVRPDCRAHFVGHGAGDRYVAGAPGLSLRPDLVSSHRVRVCRLDCRQGWMDEARLLCGVLSASLLGLGVWLVSPHPCAVALIVSPPT